MHFVVTAGPTIEPLDQVRRLTNLSTGRLGVELAAYLAAREHRVTLLLSRQAVFRAPLRGVDVRPFTTTQTLRDGLVEESKVRVDGVLHAAAVCDFTFGEVWRRSESGELVPVMGGKISTREGRLLAELVPTPKLIAELRTWYPDAWLIGWKYEVDGDQAGVLQAAQEQIEQCRTSACVTNGPAYGEGFGLVFSGEHHVHLPDAPALYAELLRTMTS